MASSSTSESDSLPVSSVCEAQRWYENQSGRLNNEGKNFFRASRGRIDATPLYALPSALPLPIQNCFLRPCTVSPPHLQRSYIAPPQNTGSTATAPSPHTGGHTARQLFCSQTVAIWTVNGDLHQALTKFAFSFTHFVLFCSNFRRILLFLVPILL